MAKRRMLAPEQARAAACRIRAGSARALCVVNVEGTSENLKPFPNPKYGNLLRHWTLSSHAQLLRRRVRSITRRLSTIARHVLVAIARLPDRGHAAEELARTSDEFRSLCPDLSEAAAAAVR